MKRRTPYLLGILLSLSLIFSTGCSSGIRDNDTYSKIDSLTDGRLDTVVSQGEQLASATDNLLKDKFGIDVAQSLGLPEDATAADYAKMLAERAKATTEEAWENTDKEALFGKAYTILTLVDPDTKVTPEMVNILVIMADGGTPETMEVLRAVLPAETVDKIDPETNETVKQVTVVLGEIRAAIDSSDKSALTEGVKKMQGLLDILKGEG